MNEWNVWLVMMVNIRMEHCFQMKQARVVSDWSNNVLLVKNDLVIISSVSLYVM